MRRRGRPWRVALCVLSAAGTAPAVPAQQGSAGIGPLPNDALALPADVGFLLGIDARSVFGSAEYKALASGKAVPGMPAGNPAELKESIAGGLKTMETEAGVNLERDLDRLVVAAADFEAKEPRIAIMAWGRFDGARITKAAEAAADTPGEKLERRTVQGRTLLVMHRGGKPDNALVFLGDGAFLFGTPAVVETTLSNHAGGLRPLQSNLAMTGLVRQLEPTASLWIAVGPAATAAMRKNAGPQPPPFPMPEAMSLAARFGGAFELAAEMPDPAAATQMVEVVKGGLAMLQMQMMQDPKSPQAPELKRTFDSLQLQATGKRARLHLPGPNGGTAAAGMIAAIAVPSFTRARVSANDSMAIGDIRTVISAETAYQHQKEAQGYGSLACLAKPGSCLKGYTGPAFLDEALGSAADKGGFKRAFHPGPPGKKPGSYESFAYTATPLEPGKSGTRSFCGDSSGRICFDPKGAAILPAGGTCPQSCTTLP